MLATGVDDHAISDIDLNADGIDDLAVALEDATPSIDFFDPLTGAPISGGFSIAIDAGGVTMDGF